MSPINSLWFKWKSLRLPWRKSFLAGSDLSGNTYWEFKDALNASRYRRIVKVDPKTHLGDVQVNPQWHQWLRHLRKDAPTIQEQQQDLVRQAQMKHLARLADERWASKPSFLDKPQTQHPGPATQTSDDTVNAPAQESRAASEQDASAETEKEPADAKEDPWAKAKGSPGENWQPDSWTPKTSGR